MTSIFIPIFETKMMINPLPDNNLKTERETICCCSKYSIPRIECRRCYVFLFLIVIIIGTIQTNLWPLSNTYNKNINF